MGAGRVQGVKRSDERAGGCRYLRFVLLLLAFGVSLPAHELQAERVSCATVVRELDAVISRRGSHRPDPVRVGIRLGVEPAWVMHCAQLYGRRVAKVLAPISDEEREDRDERWESEESVEVEREDAVQGSLEVLERRRELRSTPTPGIEEERHMLEGDNRPR